MITSPSNKQEITLSAQKESDEEEHFVDEPDEDDTETQTGPAAEGVPVKKEPGKYKKPSWVHRANLNHKSEKVDYDPYHRNPQYCHAENECIWELENFTLHYHPSVSLFAKQILKGEIVQYTGDPLQDFTLIRFLDRFVYKNPKKKEQIEEKAVSLSRKQTVPTGIKGLPVTSEQFLRLEEKRVPADDVFLHRYFQQKAVKDEKKLEDEDSDVESVTDAEFDDFLDKYEGQLDGHDFSNIDFSSEFGKKKMKGDNDEDDDDDDDLDDDLSDEEIDFEDDELAKAFRDEMEGDDSEDNEDSDDDDEMGVFADADNFAEEFASDNEGEQGGFNEEDIEFSDDDDDFADFMPKGKKRKAAEDTQSGLRKGKKSKHGDGGGLYAAAEQFSAVMDDTAGSKMNMIGSDALSNTDKADVKQLKWEVERDRWLKGGNKKHFKKGGGKFSKKGGNRPGGKSWRQKGKQKVGGPRKPQSGSGKWNNKQGKARKGKR
ncbi:CCAAT/enhancer-binding protein zeta-like [Mercenaria mercenaria]|uniref:CCAAT/enhancer-binding protein zeta-like n=1 Tax=Mercenaria mercenaria TaxID=6596 RepID=UPI00234EC399|nr:CCAAT/enhancer-binding protein zeta-like [Mercenaria mercenaria]